MKKRNTLALYLKLSALTFFTGIGTFAAEKTPVISPLPLLRFPLSVSLQTFDPSEAEDFVTIRVLANLGSGLISLDKNLKPVPDLAESYTVSADQKTFTFKLRKNLWSDGTPIVAADFVKGFEHTFSPATTAKLAQPFYGVVTGAREYKSGTIKDFTKVGLKSIGTDQVQFKLEHGTSYFLSLLALPISFPQKPSGSDYKIKPGSPTSGPYVLTEIKPDKLVLMPNEHSLHPALNRLEFLILTESAAAVSLYEKKEIDVLDKVPSQDFERFKDSPDLVSAPWLSTYYIAFNVVQGPFKDKNLREAFIRAIDRKGLAKVLRDPQRMATSLVPAPFETSQENFGPAFDPARAKELLSASPNAKDKIELVFDAQEKNNLIASYIQNQLKENLGASITLRSLEWKTYLQTLRDGKPPFFRFAWLASFPDALSHLQVFTGNNPNNYTGYANAEFDKLVEEVSKTAAGQKRIGLIRQAQTKLLTDDLVVVPLYHYVQYVLIRQNWQGLELTPMGLLYLSRATPRTSP